MEHDIKEEGYTMEVEGVKLLAQSMKKKSLREPEWILYITLFHFIHLPKYYRPCFFTWLLGFS
jgi:hypothetical protein